MKYFYFISCCVSPYLTLFFPRGVLLRSNRGVKLAQAVVFANLTDAFITLFKLCSQTIITLLWGWGHCAVCCHYFPISVYSDHTQVLLFQTSYFSVVSAKGSVMFVVHLKCLYKTNTSTKMILDIIQKKVRWCTRHSYSCTLIHSSLHLATYPIKQDSSFIAQSEWSSLNGNFWFAMLTVNSQSSKHCTELIQHANLMMEYENGKKFGRHTVNLTWPSTFVCWLYQWPRSRWHQTTYPHKDLNTPRYCSCVMISTLEYWLYISTQRG